MAAAVSISAVHLAGDAGVVGAGGVAAMVARSWRGERRQAARGPGRGCDGPRGRHWLLDGLGCGVASAILPAGAELAPMASGRIRATFCRQR